MSTQVAIEAHEAHPDETVAFCNVDPMSPDAIERLNAFRDSGVVKGFGEHKVHLPVDHPRNLEIYRLCGEFGWPVLIHMDYTGAFGTNFPALESVVRSLPDTTFIGHAMAWWTNISADPVTDPRSPDFSDYPMGPAKPIGTTDRLLTEYPTSTATSPPVPATSPSSGTPTSPATSSSAIAKDSYGAPTARATTDAAATRTAPFAYASVRLCCPCSATHASPRPTSTTSPTTTGRDCSASKPSEEYHNATIQDRQPERRPPTSRQVFPRRTSRRPLIVIAGQVALDIDGELVGENDVAAQTRQVFRNMSAVLTGSGSSYANVVEFTYYIVGRENVPGFMDARTAIFDEAYPNGDYPPATLLVVSGLANEDFLVEVSALATM